MQFVGQGPGTHGPGSEQKQKLEPGHGPAQLGGHGAGAHAHVPAQKQTPVPGHGPHAPGPGQKQNA